MRLVNVCASSPSKRQRLIPEVRRGEAEDIDELVVNGIERLATALPDVPVESHVALGIEAPVWRPIMIATNP